MDFDTLIAPLSRVDFMRRYHEGSCFVVRGDADKFRDLITLQEIEDALNQGCNLNSPVNMISNDGTRKAFVTKNVSWSTMAVKKQEVLDLIRSRHSFMMTNMSQINPRVAQLLDTLEDTFSEDNLHADLHLYVSSTREASTYNAHRDYPQHKIFLQVIGSTEWWVYHHSEDLPLEARAVEAADEPTYLEEAAHFTLNPGDMFYMPPAVFHKVRNLGGPRVSFSIPLVPVRRDIPRMDRTYIPFRDIFEEETRAAAADDAA